MELPLYQIVDWDYTFENFRSREIDRCQYLNIPNKHGGSGWSNVVGEKDGSAIYGIWVLICQLCSRQRRHKCDDGKLRREGYLTSDGKKDGRRWSALELSNLFRRPIHEILRTLQVLSSERVGWIVLIDGRWSDDTRTMVGRYSDDAASIAGRCSVDDDGRCEVDADRKIDRKIDTLTGSEKEKAAESDIDSTTMLGRCSDDGRTMDERWSDDTDVIQHAEAKILLTSLCEDVFPKELRQLRGPIWPDDWNHLLDDALPLPRRDWELIAWAYRQPASDKIHDVTMLRQTFDSLLKNIRSEPQKIESARKRLGLNGLNDTLSGQAKPEPAGWREIAEKEYEGVPMPESFWQLSETARRRVLALQEGGIAE